MLASDPRWGLVPTMPAWLQPDDSDTLFGIERIAAWLALPFLDVRTMVGMGRLPTSKDGRSHLARRTNLATFFLDLEKNSVPDAQRGPPPGDLRADDALGLLSGQHAMAAFLDCTHAGLRHRRAELGLCVFWIGKTPFARKASLERWRAGQVGETRSRRRLATISAKRASAAPAGALVGGAAIAAYLGRSLRGTWSAIHRGQLPVTRVGSAVVADPETLAAHRRDQLMEAQNGVR